MKMVKTEFNHKVNEGSSWIVYITRTLEEAHNLHVFALTQKDLLTGASCEWYYTVSTVEVINDCRVPAFFHNRGYYATIIEHNNGSWDAAPKYELYIAE